jgi:hypothetical protein
LRVETRRICTVFRPLILATSLASLSNRSGIHRNRRITSAENIQCVFWGFLIIFAPITISFAGTSRVRSITPYQYAWMIGVVAAVAVALWAFNHHHRAKSAVLYFEEVPPELIMMLGLASIRLSENRDRP